LRAYVEQVKLEASMPSKREQELLDVMLTQVTDDKVRRVAEMYYVEGYTSGEISRVIGIPVSTVTTWMSRLMAKVRAKLIADGLDTVR
jgi:DNA-directed RNA polymerase specialized sigma24 family protein